MDPGHHSHFAAQQHQCGGEAANITVPTRVFPGEDRLQQEQQRRHGGGTGGKNVGMGGGGSSGKDGDGEGGSGGARGPGKGHSADILAIAHCGHQQVTIQCSTLAKEQPTIYDTSSLPPALVIIRTSRST